MAMDAAATFAALEMMDRPIIVFLRSLSRGCDSIVTEKSLTGNLNAAASGAWMIPVIVLKVPVRQRSANGLRTKGLPKSIFCRFCAILSRIGNLAVLVSAGKRNNREGMIEMLFTTCKMGRW